jgi:hypothetical protein
VPVVDANQTAIGSASTISASADFTCAALADTTALCWGDDSVGQLGTPPPTVGNTWLSVPVVVTTEGGGNLSNVSTISAGSAFLGSGQACATLATGALECWGDNTWGELQVASSTPYLGAAHPIASPSDLTSPEGAENFVGGGFVCARLVSVGVSCWGRNDLGQLGRTTNVGTITATPVPARIAGLSSNPSVADYYAYPIRVSLKVKGVYQSFATAPPCQVLDQPSASIGVLGTLEAQNAHFCSDVWASTRDWETANGELTRVVLFVEDPRFTPISR